MELNLNQRAGVEKSQKNIASQLWFKYFPYWPLFLLVFLGAVTAAWFKLRYTTPMYESTATLLIKDEKKGIDDSKIVESLNQLSTKKIIENEIEVIKSRSLMVEVVKNLHLYAQVYEKGKIRNLSAYASSPIQVEAQKPDSITGTGEVFFTYDNSKTQVVIDNLSYPVNQWVTTKYGTLKFIPQPISSNPPVKPLYFVLINPKYVASGLVGALNVSSASKLASIINLKLQDEVPARSEDILNGLIDAYYAADVNDKNILAKNTLASVEQRLNVVGRDLDSIEKKLQEYKSTQGAIDISSQGQSFIASVSANDQEIAKINMQLGVLDKVANYVKAKGNASGTVPSTLGLENQLLTQLIDNLYKAEVEYEKKKSTVGLNHPDLISIADQIEKIRPSILENIESQQRNLESTKNSLDITNSRYNSLLSNIPKKERDLVDISRKQATISSIYNFLLQKREETELSHASASADSRLVDKAQSSFWPVSPNPKKFYMMALALAFAVAIGLITAIEMFKRTILFRHEIENFTSIPIIGEIVHEKSKNPLVIGEGKRTFIAEQFRKLRTSLPYIGIKGERKKILITSSISGDGKSFIVANLGLSLAMVDKKVIVLEFDLSNPTLTDKLSTTVNKGLTDYLKGEAEPEEVIRRSAVNENLFVMPAGNLPDNPSELIMSERVRDLMEYLTPLFDYIIIDTAPVGLLSDAYVLSNYCDACLYVIRHRHTPKVSVERMDANNRINELKNLAIVFNGVRSRGFGKNVYGYGYGYGYIHKEKEVKKKRYSKKTI
jgi:tyrosine-protein kinase Etk/Wzc